MSTKNYKMIAKLESGNWTAWVAKTTPDYTGASYTGGGTLITNTIQVSGTYLDVGDYYYMMIGKLTTGEWVTWGSFYSPDRLGIYYEGAGTLIQDTIQVSRFYEYTGIPPIFVNEYSLLFGGTDEYVTMGDVLDFDKFSKFSISCWFKTSSSDIQQYLVSKFSNTVPTFGWGLRINSAKLEMLLYASSTREATVITDATFVDGNWHHVIATIAGTSSASGTIIYIDGNIETLSVVEDTLTAAYDIFNTGSLNISGRTDGFTQVFVGNIDEVSIYNKELSLSEVQAIYNSGTPTNIKNLSSASNMVGYWRCGDGDTYPTILDHSSDYQFPTIPDETLNGYHGTATNMEVSDIQFASPGSQALVFGGSNEYVNMGNVLSYEYNQPFSFGFWIKTTAISDYIFSKMEGSGNYRGYGCYILATGKLHVLLINANTTNKIDVDSTTSINNGLWNYVVITYDGSGLAAGISIYINGALDTPVINSDSLAEGSITNAINFNISGRTNGSLVLVGSVGDFSSWNKELSSAEVSEIYNNKVPINLTTVSCSANLAGWWRCGENYSLAANGVPDFSGNGLHGTQVNMEITDVESRTYIGNSMLFGGTDEYVTMGNVLGYESTHQWTFSLWINTSAVQDYLLSKMDDSVNYRGYGIYITAAGLVQVLLGSTNVLRIDTITTNAINTGAWRHVTVTYDGSGNAAGVRVFFDGAEETMNVITSTLGSNTIINTESFNISSRTSGMYPLNGRIDEVSNWNKVLTPAEVADIYNGGIPTDNRLLSSAPNLVAYWRMGDGVGFNGTMTNMEAEDIVADVP